MKRKTVKVKDEDVSKIIDRMLDGEIVGVENGSVSKRICWKLRELRKRGKLKTAYSQDERCSYLWFTRDVDEDTLNHKRSSVFGDIWEMVLGY